MKTKNIRQSVFINAAPSKVYAALMSPSKHARFTGAAAKVQNKEGTAFSFYDGYITGTNITLEKDRKIVQHWRAMEDGWPEDHFSEVSFLLSDEKGGTRIKFAHTGVPEHVAANIDKGWYEYYWEPLKLMLE